jgi:hypothetical protein
LGSEHTIGRYRVRLVGVSPYDGALHHRSPSVGAFGGVPDFELVQARILPEIVSAWTFSEQLPVRDCGLVLKDVRNVIRAASCAMPGPSWSDCMYVRAVTERYGAHDQYRCGVHFYLWRVGELIMLKTLSFRAYFADNSEELCESVNVRTLNEFLTLFQKGNNDGSYTCETGTILETGNGR